MKQMFVRASVVLGKRYEHNLATERDHVLHCGSLMPAAVALGAVDSMSGCFFSVQRLHGFRQVVQQNGLLHVANWD